MLLRGVALVLTEAAAIGFGGSFTLAGCCPMRHGSWDMSGFSHPIVFLVAILDGIVLFSVPIALLSILVWTVSPRTRSSINLILCGGRRFAKSIAWGVLIGVLAGLILTRVGFGVPPL
jgi:hypothetical protein